MAEPVKCRHPKCNVMLAFCLTKANKQAPVDWESLDPEEKQSYRMGMVINYTPKETTTVLGQPEVKDKHINHFITCPYARGFKKKG